MKEDKKEPIHNEPEIEDSDEELSTDKSDSNGEEDSENSDNYETYEECSERFATFFSFNNIIWTFLTKVKIYSEDESEKSEDEDILEDKLESMWDNDLECDKSDNESEDSGMPFNFPINPFVFLNNLGEHFGNLMQDSEEDESDDDESSDDMQDWWKTITLLASNFPSN